MARIKQETIILNDYGNTKAFIRRRTSGKGKAKDRITIDISAEPIVHMFDDAALGAGPAEAIRDVVAKGIKEIGQAVSDKTLERRDRSARNNTTKTYIKRYTGGRIGTKLPGQAGRGTMFNDSGRLAEGLFVRQNTKTSNADFNARVGSWTTNVPANRFTKAGGGHPDTQHLVKQLMALVPVLKDSRKLLNDPKVRIEIVKSMDQLIIKAKNLQDAKRKALRLAKLNAARAALTLVRSLV